MNEYQNLAAKALLQKVGISDGLLDKIGRILALESDDKTIQSINLEAENDGYYGLNRTEDSFTEIHITVQLRKNFSTLEELAIYLNQHEIDPSSLSERKIPIIGYYRLSQKTTSSNKEKVDVAEFDLYKDYKPRVTFINPPNSRASLNS